MALGLERKGSALDLDLAASISKAQSADLPAKATAA